MFWKYRAEIIFSAAVCFAAKALILPDTASVCGLVLMLSAHYVDRYFGEQRFESKAMRRLILIEEEQRNLKVDISRIMLASGIRGPK